jgi:hypothetical protein
MLFSRLGKQSNYQYLCFSKPKKAEDDEDEDPKIKNLMKKLP